MNVHARKDKPATYQDVLDAPEHLVAEIINGILHTHPRPVPKHALVGSMLGVEIGGPFGRGTNGPGGWWILGEPEIHLGDHVLVPDMAGWRRGRMPTLPETAYFEPAPDWVCEILSPSTRRYDLTEKRDIYGAFDVPFLWFVDPDARTLEAFELKDNRWVLVTALQGEVDVSVRPFEAIGFPLNALWAD